MTNEERGYLHQFEAHMGLAKQTGTTLNVPRIALPNLIDIYNRYFVDKVNPTCYNCLVRVFRGLYEVYHNGRPALNEREMTQPGVTLGRKPKQKTKQNDSE